MALTAAVCGAESCSDFADFAVDREDLFREFLRLENGVPSHDTFSRIFRLLDPAAFASCFGRFVEDLGAGGKGVIAIDGKDLAPVVRRCGAGQPPCRGDGVRLTDLKRTPETATAQSSSGDTRSGSRAAPRASRSKRASGGS